MLVSKSFKVTVEVIVILQKDCKISFNSVLFCVISHKVESKICQTFTFTLDINFDPLTSMEIGCLISSSASMQNLSLK